MRTRIRHAVERRLGIRIFREPPLGTDVYHDLKMIPAWSPSGVIFDVGANVGQTVTSLARSFPQAPIYSFEPAPGTYEQLVRGTGHLKNVRRFNFGFGSERGSAQLFLHRYADQNTLRRDLHDAPGYRDRGATTVEVRTLDDFIEEEGIDFVQYLKIDTEGFDLEVLKGAENAFATGRLGVVEVEAGFLQDEGKFIPLEEFRIHLRDRNFLLFGIYEQVRRHRTRLRRCNAVFISERLAE